MAVATATAATLTPATAGGPAAVSNAKTGTAGTVGRSKRSKGLFKRFFSKDKKYEEVVDSAGKRGKGEKEGKGGKGVKGAAKGTAKAKGGKPVKGKGGNGGNGGKGAAAKGGKATTAKGGKEVSNDDDVDPANPADPTDPADPAALSPNHVQIQLNNPTNPPPTKSVQPMRTSLNEHISKPPLNKTFQLPVDKPTPARHTGHGGYNGYKCSTPRSKATLSTASTMASTACSTNMSNMSHASLKHEDMSHFESCASTALENTMETTLETTMETALETTMDSKESSFLSHGSMGGWGLFDVGGTGGTKDGMVGRVMSTVNEKGHDSIASGDAGQSKQSGQSFPAGSADGEGGMAGSAAGAGVAGLSGSASGSGKAGSRPGTPTNVVITATSGAGDGAGVGSGGAGGGSQASHPSNQVSHPSRTNSRSTPIQDQDESNFEKGSSSFHSKAQGSRNSSPVHQVPNDPVNNEENGGNAADLANIFANTAYSNSFQDFSHEKGEFEFEIQDSSTNPFHQSGIGGTSKMSFQTASTPTTEQDSSYRDLNADPLLGGLNIVVNGPEEEGLEGLEDGILGVEEGFEEDFTPNHSQNSGSNGNPMEQQHQQHASSALPKSSTSPTLPTPPPSTLRKSNPEFIFCEEQVPEAQNYAKHSSKRRSSRSDRGGAGGERLDRSDRSGKGERGDRHPRDRDREHRDGRDHTRGGDRHNPPHEEESQHDHLYAEINIRRPRSLSSRQGSEAPSLAMTSISSLTGRSSLFHTPEYDDNNHSFFARYGDIVGGIGNMVSHGIHGVNGNHGISGAGDAEEQPKGEKHRDGYYDSSANTNANGNGMLDKLSVVLNEAFKNTCRCFDMADGNGEDEGKTINDRSTYVNTAMAVTSTRGGGRSGRRHRSKEVEEGEGEDGKVGKESGATELEEPTFSSPMEN